MKLLFRWLITAFSLFVAARLVKGIQVEGNAWAVFAATAIILGLVNALIRPLLKLLSCPLIILTLGLFVLVINAVSLLIVSIVSVVLSALLREEHHDRDQ
jgi:putative membrane protein